MTKLFLLIPFLLSTVSNQAQLIKGRVVEFSTDKPIPYATIYFDGTLQGTSSDSSGFFSLKLPVHKSSLIVSAIGFYSTSLAIPLSPDNFLKVELKEKSYTLTEIVVHSKQSSKKDQRIFLNEFLGTSATARQCAIVNLEDITIAYDAKTKTLTAFCDQPLVIRNKALGYTLHYYLDTFSKTSNNLFFVGHYIFKKDSSLSKASLNQAKRKRMHVYKGSRMHFMRSLWENSLDKNGFEIYTTQSKRVYSNDIVVREAGSQTYIRTSDKKLKIVYFSNPSSYLILEKDLVLIDQNGYFDPSGVIWQGSIANQRVGDLLPFEYEEEE